MFRGYQLEATMRDPGPAIRVPEDAWLAAELKIVATEDGGRYGPFSSSYRPQWWVGHYREGERAHNDAEVYLVDRAFAFPGETVRVRLRPVSPEYWEHVRVGSELVMYEGARELGHAQVTEVLPRPS